MLKILGHPGLDPGQFPDLMSVRQGIAPAQSLLAASAADGAAFDDLLALFAGNQGACVLDVARLPASQTWFGVGMSGSLLGFEPGGLACGCWLLGGTDEF